MRSFKCFLLLMLWVPSAFSTKVIYKWNHFANYGVDCPVGMRCTSFHSCLRCIGLVNENQPNTSTAIQVRERYSISGHFSPATVSKHLLRQECPGTKRVCCPAFYKIVVSFHYKQKKNETHSALTDGTQGKAIGAEDTNVVSTSTTVTSSTPPIVNSKDKLRRQANRKLLEKNCAQSLDVRISFGEKVKAGELPWTVMLKFNDGGTLRYSCGGSLISDRYVLTAAHCAKPRTKNMKLVSARLGEVNLDSNCDQMAEQDDYQNSINNIFAGKFTPEPKPICAEKPQDIDVEEVIIHPEYKYDFIEGFPNDVALIRLKEKAKVSHTVRPICLRGLQNLNPEQEQQGILKVAGWGMTDMSKGPQGSDLMQVTVKRVPRHLCREEHRVMANHRCQKCAGSRSGSACMGDSGGPLLLKTQANMTSLAGVVSFGAYDCGTSEVPSVFSDVSCYLDWIIDTIRP